MAHSATMVSAREHVSGPDGLPGEKWKTAQSSSIVPLAPSGNYRATFGERDYRRYGQRRGETVAELTFRIAPLVECKEL